MIQTQSDVVLVHLILVQSQSDPSLSCDSTVVLFSLGVMPFQSLSDPGPIWSYLSRISIWPWCGTGLIFLGFWWDFSLITVRTQFDLVLFCLFLQGDEQAPDGGAGQENLRQSHQTGAGVHRAFYRWTSSHVSEQNRSFDSNRVSLRWFCLCPCVVQVLITDSALCSSQPSFRATLWRRSTIRWSRSSRSSRVRSSGSSPRRSYEDQSRLLHRSSL